ncbi:MAG: hypothetical protein SPK32_03365, partial [Bacteroidaceae bacterium]|nr:hypothetical protein [Bacteroidaceae bacterium]
MELSIGLPSLPSGLKAHVCGALHFGIGRRRASLMQTNDNQRQSNRIYDRNLKEWFEVPADYYKEYDRERTAFRKRMQDHGRCCCPRDKWWLCDMFCEDCEYRRAGDMLSLDAPEGDGSVTMLDQQEVSGPRMEDVIADRDLLARLIARLRELDPDADAI